jgi:hypothetical protein
MKSSPYSTYVLLAFLCTTLSLLATGCSSAPPLTKEERALKRQFGREVAEDRAYEVTPAGFSVRPVQEPFITTYYRRIGDDGILFWLDGEPQRDPKYYAGKLSTYLLGLDLYGADSTALASLQTLISHGNTPHQVRVLGDSVYQMHDRIVHQFDWKIIKGGTTAPTAQGMLKGEFPDAEMLGAIICSDRGTYLLYWVENELPGMTYTGQCWDWGLVEQTQASARLKARFQRFVNGIQFDL